MTTNRGTLPTENSAGEHARSEPLAGRTFPSRFLQTAAASTPWLVLAIFLAAAVRADLGLRSALAGLAVVLVTQVIPGTAIWRSVRPAVGSLIEDLVVGFAIGSCLAVMAQAFASSVRQPWIAAAVGPTVAGVLWLIPATRRRLLEAYTARLPLLWGPTVAFVALLHLVPTQSFYRSNPVRWVEGFRAVYVDLPFHLAIVGQLAHRGPTVMPYLQSEPLQYHWFSHAWVAQVAVLSGSPLDLTLLRFQPAILAFVVVVAVAVAAVRLSGRPWTGPLAAFVAVTAGHLDVTGQFRGTSIVAHLSPSFSFSVPMAMAIIILMALRWRGEARSGSAAVLVVLAVGAAGMKGSTLPVLIAGLAFALGVAMLGRWSGWRRLGVDLAILTAVFLATLVIIFRGAAQGLALDPWAAVGSLGLGHDLVEKTVVTSAWTAFGIAAVVLLSVLARGAGLALWQPGERRRDVLGWFLLGTGLAGAGAVLLFSHAGRSQWYFMRTAVPTLAIGTAMGVLDAARRWHRPWAISTFGILVGLMAFWATKALVGPLSSAEGDGLRHYVIALAVFWAVLATGALIIALSSSPLRSAPVLGVIVVAVLAATIAPGILRSPIASLAPPAEPVEATDTMAFSADQIEAARHIRDNSGVDDLVATNRHCTSPEWERCDSRRFHVAAFTERQMLIEGWAYTPTWAAQEELDGLSANFKPFWDEELLRTNEKLFATPSEEVIASARALGVRWLFGDKTRPYSDALNDFAALRFDSAWARVYELEAQ